MSASARTLKSSAERRWIALASRRTSVGVPLKSKRCPTSFSVWLIALSTSCRSSLHTTSNDGMGGRSIGRRLHDVNPGGWREVKHIRLELHVALLAGELDARGGACTVDDASLGDAGIGLAHAELQRADPGILLLGCQREHPLLWLVACQGGVEVALDLAQPGEERHRRARLKRLSERSLDHLLQVALVDPERFPITDDALCFGRIVIPAHAVRLLERDLALALEGPRQGLRLDGLVEVRLHRPRGVVALLQAIEGIPERV